uniref:Mitochondrial carrier protein n=1 Tax=Fibrocapsa japonica TaxID=94617 RepID=A0A7S2UYM5_9STRA|mmetsp:Transcript_20583/g.29784  ORF Transcript_20583/g.29784 Transcript_20583/m.29784 type:complete len:282 (+) Transcript_20583:120-965(+)
MDLMKDAISGTVGAICCTYVGQPLDVIKTRLQTVFKDKTFSEAVLQTTRSEGVFALWKGSLPGLASGLVENVAVFAANGAAKRFVMNCQEGRPLSFTQEAMVGGFSGLCAAISICPPEVVKVRMQVMSNCAQLSFANTISAVWKEGGVAPFFRGLPAGISRDVPFYMIFFSTYEGYLRLVSSTSGEQNLEKEAINPIHFIMGGGVAGMVSWGVVFPLDVIKSRQQISKEKLSFVEAGRHILYKEGLRKAMKGWSAAALRGFPANAALFLGVEWSQKILGSV